MTGAAAAAEMLDQSIIVEPWEYAVAAALRVLVQIAADASTGDALLDLVDRYITLPIGSGHAVFATRLGLAVVDLAYTTGQARHARDRAADHLVHHAITIADGYVARLVLAHTAPELLAPHQAAQLTATLAAAGLHSSSPADEMRFRLNAALPAPPPPPPGSVPLRERIS